MKGDYTRTGERKFSGLMKDGVKSANRLATFVMLHMEEGSVDTDPLVVLHAKP